MENKQEMFNRIRKDIKAGDQDTIHFIMTQARNISAYVIRNTNEGPDSNEA